MTTLITGAGNGIGRGLALTFGGRGDAIAAIDVREADLGAVAETLRSRNGRCAYRVADVTDAGLLQSAILDLERELGPIDRVVANAGVGFETSGLKLDAAAMGRVIDVNLKGVVNTFAAVLPGMIDRRRGHLVALSSVASYRGLPRMLGYCASKAGVNAVMEGLAVDLHGMGIDLTTICPAWIRTAMTADLHDKLDGILEIDDAIARIAWAIERKRTFYAFPRKTAWMLSSLRWLPRSWQTALVARMARKVRTD